MQYIKNLFLRLFDKIIALKLRLIYFYAKLKIRKIMIHLQYSMIETACSSAHSKNFSDNSQTHLIIALQSSSALCAPLSLPTKLWWIVWSLQFFGLKLGTFVFKSWKNCNESKHKISSDNTWKEKNIHLH